MLGDSSNKNVFESNVAFDYVVNYNGKKYYFMDLLDNDLMKINEITHYRKDEYERDGKKVLVLTSTADFHKEFHQQMLNHINHIEYLTVDPRKVTEFAYVLSNKNVFEEGEE